jgi:GLPGLI family protein
MKTKFLILMILAMPAVSFPQKNDSAYSRAGYFFTIKDSATKNISTDSLIVEIGGHTSVCFSEWNNQTNRLLKKMAENIEQTNSKTIDFTKVPPHKYGMQTQVFKDFKTGNMTVVDQIINDKYYYEDSLNLFNWHIYPDTATISGYLCQRAETNFRGRHYISWFTNQVPVSNGPLKFGGLPGLIVKLQDDRGRYSFILLSFEKLSKKLPINFSKASAKLVSRNKLRELKRAFFEDPVSVLNSMGSSITFNSGNPAPKNKYEPMELE